MRAKRQSQAIGPAAVRKIHVGWKEGRNRVGRKIPVTRNGPRCPPGGRRSAGHLWRNRGAVRSHRRQIREGRAGLFPPYRSLSGKILGRRSEEHTSELQSLMRISYAVFCLKKKNHTTCRYPNIILLNTNITLYSNIT